MVEGPIRVGDVIMLADQSDSNRPPWRVVVVELLPPCGYMLQDPDPISRWPCGETYLRQHGTRLPEKE